MRRYTCLPLLGAALCALALPANAAVILTVGPTGQYSTIAAAVAVADADANAGHYYDIVVAPGTYTNDFPDVTRAMTITANPNYAGQVLLDATEPLPNEKGIIVTSASLIVNGLTFEGAEIDNSLGGNGAGIRDQNTGSGASLIVANSTFTGNQEGILTGYDSSEAIQILNSKFENNGNPDSDYFQHALYVNYAGSLTVNNSLFCGQLIGHDIKSRAQVTTVANSQIYDGEADPAAGCGAGSTSLGIDLPDGGIAQIVGNQIIQGAATENYKMIGYGEEGLSYANNGVLLSGNVFTNIGAPNPIALYDPQCVGVLLVDDTFNGVTTEVSPSGCVAGGSPAVSLAAAPARTADDPPAVPEPNGGGLLLAALGGWAVAAQLRKRRRSCSFPPRATRRLFAGPPGPGLSAAPDKGARRRGRPRAASAFAGNRGSRWTSGSHRRLCGRASPRPR